MNLEDIAAVCHEANRVHCISIGDLSQPHWEEAPGWQQQSAIDGVTAIKEGRVNGPADSHRSWSEEKVRDGWTWGPVKDPEKKQHPCLVPFHDLPLEQRLKDVLFFTVASNLLHLSNMTEALTAEAEFLKA